jgi:hypothetical protein
MVDPTPKRRRSAKLEVWQAANRCRLKDLLAHNVKPHFLSKAKALGFLSHAPGEFKLQLASINPSMATQFTDY